MYEPFDKIRYQYDVKRRENLEKNKQISQDRLKKVLNTKFTTTIIGALNTFEKKFGYLWNHGAPFNELTADEKDFREMWNNTRHQILDKGNNQLRSALLEVSEYDVVWNKKNYIFDIVNKGE